MAFGLIIVGDEILSGKREDQHLRKVIELLAVRGLTLAWCDYVGDEPQRITAVLRRAFASGDIVFCTGGIGATPDDHTRQCAARALGVELALHPDAAALIRERMQDMARAQGVAHEPERADNLHRLNMALFPVGATIIPNPYNKIAGFSCESPALPSGDGASPAAGKGGGILNGDGPPLAVKAPLGGSAPREAGERGGIHFFPGFPVMAWPMLEWVLDSKYGHLHHQRPQVEKSVIVLGAMEAALTPLMERIEADHPGVKVFSLPSVDHPAYGKHIDLGVKGAPAQVEAAFAQLKTGLHQFGASLGPELVRS